MSYEMDVSYLKKAHSIGLEAMKAGKHPFGAILVAPDGTHILDTQGNIDTVNHAESTLARRAAASFQSDFLWKCSLYTSVEPCCMCSGTMYWANIGRIVYGLSEEALQKITGNNPENPTMSLPCKAVIDCGQKPVEIVQISSMDSTIADAHRAFWESRT